jgi:hypothetical protein
MPGGVDAGLRPSRQARPARMIAVDVVDAVQGYLIGKPTGHWCAWTTDAFAQRAELNRLASEVGRETLLREVTQMSHLVRRSRLRPRSARGARWTRSTGRDRSRQRVELGGDRPSRSVGAVRRSETRSTLRMRANEMDRQAVVAVLVAVLCRWNCNQNAPGPIDGCL